MVKIPPVSAETAGRKEPLTVPLPEFRTRTTHLFRELLKDDALQDMFMKNPTRLLSEWVLHEELPAQQAADWNHLLYSVLSNDAFLAWANDYARIQPARRMDRNAFARDFTMKLLELGDKTLLGSVLNSVAAGHGLPGIGDVARQFVCNNAAGSCFVVPVAQNQRAESSQNFTSRTTSQQSASSSAASSVDSAESFAVSSQIAASASSESQSSTESGTQSSVESGTESSAESSAESSTGSATDSGTESATDSGAESQSDSAGIGSFHGWDTALMRSVTEQLVAHARALRASGELDRTIGGFNG